MSIYAKKNARGQPTGLWIVEVQVNGKRLRETTRDHESAVERERQLKATGGSQPVHGPSTAILERTRGYLVSDLKREALVVWKGTKDELQSVQRFEAVCDVLGPETPLAAVRTTQLDQVVDVLRGRSLGNKTIHRYLSALSRAMRWAVERDKLAGMPIFPWPKCGKGNDTVLAPEDEAKVLARLREAGSPDLLIVCDALLATGCRIGELLDLSVDDIGPASVTFRDTKNDDDRTVPVEPELAARMRALATVGWPSYRRVNTALHRARKDVGVKYKVTPHVLRHTVGTRLSDNGVALPTIGKILGHRNIKTTMGYIHAQDDAVKRAAELLKRKQGEEV